MRTRIHDLRTNQHFTLKENPLSYTHLEDFVAVYNADNRLARTETELFKRFSYDDLVARDIPAAGWTTRGSRPRP
jgi:type I restriction enzyme M protein